MCLPLLAFVFGSIVMAALAMALIPSRAGAIDRRIDELTTGRIPDEVEKPRLQSVVDFMKRVGENGPRSAKELSSLRLRRVQSECRREEALSMFFGCGIVFPIPLFIPFWTSFFMK